MNGLSFEQDADGNWGYRKPGADTVTPFSNTNYNVKIVAQNLGEYGASASYTVTEDCILICTGFVQGGTWSYKLSGYSEIISQSKSGSQAIAVIKATAGNTVVSGYNYNLSGQIGGGIIAKYE